MIKLREIACGVCLVVDSRHFGLRRVLGGASLLSDGTLIPCCQVLRCDENRFQWSLLLDRLTECSLEKEGILCDVT